MTDLHLAHSGCAAAALPREDAASRQRCLTASVHQRLWNEKDGGNIEMSLKKMSDGLSHKSHQWALNSKISLFVTVERSVLEPKKAH